MSIPPAALLDCDFFELLPVQVDATNSVGRRLVDEYPMLSIAERPVAIACKPNIVARDGVVVSACVDFNPPVISLMDPLGCLVA